MTSISLSEAKNKQLILRDERIIEHLSSGFTAKEIAGRVGMTTRGLEKRIATLRRRYNARSAAHLVVLYKALASSVPVG
jgi:FixJ family two-component response regulator